MPFARFNGTVQDEAGNAINGAEIEVRNEQTGFLQVLYSDRSGNNALDNPFDAQSGANFFFHALGGNYSITARKGTFEKTWRWQPLGTMQSEDLEELLIAVQSGIIPAGTLAELEAIVPDPEVAAPVAGVVLATNDSGYYLYNYGTLTWDFVRPLPDTLAVLSLVSTSGNEVNFESAPGVTPSSVTAYVLDFGAWENTGPVTAVIDGGAPIPIRDYQSNEFAEGQATGRIFVTNETVQLREIVGSDIVNRAYAFAELARLWASEDEDVPVEGGEYSAKHYMLKAKEFADRYLGSSATAPTTRTDGSPLQDGDWYFDTVVSGGFFWDAASTQWVAMDIRLLSQMLDVDLTTVPPSGGDGLVYDDVEEKWKPGPAGGGMFKGNLGTVGSRSGDIFRINANLLTADTTIQTGQNASCAGPLAVDDGVTLTIEDGATLVIV